jgi:hypothetical protein
MIEPHATDATDGTRRPSTFAGRPATTRHLEVDVIIGANRARGTRDPSRDVGGQAATCLGIRPAAGDTSPTRTCGAGASRCPWVASSSISTAAQIAPVARVRHHCLPQRRSQGTPYTARMISLPQTRNARYHPAEMQRRRPWAPNFSQSLRAERQSLWCSLSASAYTDSADSSSGQASRIIRDGVCWSP